MEVSVETNDILLPHYRGRLLEGISYNKSNNSLLWVDIIVGEVHRYFFDTGKHDILKLSIPGDSFGTIGFTKDDDKIIACSKDGINMGDFNTGSIVSLKKYPDNERVRSNDGKIDPHGNLMVGTMSDFPYELKPEGTFYKLTHDSLKLTSLIEEVGISNGLGWNSTLTKFYWTDSPTKNVYVFDYDKNTQTFSNKSVFFSTTSMFGDDTGYVPDGMCITDKDHIFVSLFGPGLVVHLNEAGEVLHKYQLPAGQITCCTVGGMDDDELYVTTALKGLEDLSKKVEDFDTGDDMGGHLFRIKIGDYGKETQFIWGGDV